MTASLIPALLMTAVLGGSPRGVVLDFSATWCGPCQQMNPIVSRLERQGYSIRKVDVDQERELATQFGISSIPAFVLVVDGKEVTRITGATSEEQLRRLLAQIPTDPPAVATVPSRNLAPVGSRIAEQDGRMQEMSGDDTQPGRPETMAPAVEVADTAPQPAKSGNLLGRLLGRKEEPPAAQSPSVIRALDEDASDTINLLPVRNPLAASVRVHVTVNGLTSVGSGTAIDSQVGRTVVATCGHLFNGWNEQSKIEIEVFSDRGIRRYLGRMLSYDTDADVGIVTINTDAILPTAQVPDVDRRPQTGDEVVNIGCSGGAVPSQETATVTALNYFEGPDNIECTGVPVQGRSGGGLFNRDGQLVGICIGADAQRQRGAYAGLLAIHDQLDAARLTSLYRATRSEAGTVSLADATPSTGEPEEILADAATPAAETQPMEPVFEGMNGATAAALTTAGDAEVICIIRDRRNPESPCRIVIIDRASSKFLSYLGGEVANTAMARQPDAVQARRVTPPTAASPDAGSSRPPQQLADPQSFFRASESSRPLFTQPGRVRTGERSRTQSIQPTALENPFVPQRYVRTRTEQ